jgi:hypothetical protein
MYAATHAFTTTVQHFKFLSFILFTNLSTFTIECLSIFLSLARSFSSSLALFSVFTFTLLHTHLQRQYLVKLNLHLCVPLANSRELLHLLLLVCVYACVKRSNCRRRHSEQSEMLRIISQVPPAVIQHVILN